MNFFRRLFNDTPPADEPEQDKNTVNNPDETENNPPEAGITDNAPSDDTLSTDEDALPQDILAEYMDDDAPRDDDETLPDPPFPVAANIKTDRLEDREPPNTKQIPNGVTRPLPQSSNMPVSSGHVLFGQASDQGMIRNNNQDAALSMYFTSDSVDEQPDFGIFIVADGMGGHIHGEKASALTTRTVASHIMQTLYMPLLNGEDINNADRPTIAEALTQAVKQANQQVLESVPDGGTTITSVVIFNNIAYIAHVGDSRAYLLPEEGGMEQITRDHSLVQRLIELNQITPEEATTHDQRNVLYRAIGQSDDLEVDTLTRRLPAGSRLLLCSDGLWGMIENDDIQDIIGSTPDPQEACDKLIALANTQGGNDNITAVLLKIPGY
jgi:serine/threonine protein phosphatase PrpC